MIARSANWKAIRVDATVVGEVMDPPGLFAGRSRADICVVAVRAGKILVEILTEDAACGKPPPTEGTTSSRN